MEWFRQLGRAIRNLARISRQNPIWAITALTLSPIEGIAWKVRQTTLSENISRTA